MGEPTNPDAIGDMIKIGRRGSLSGTIIVYGIQGHAAYPHLTENPVRGMMTLLDALIHPAYDKGTKDFQPSNMEVTTVDVGNPAVNVIPARATASFNIRFNDTWTAETLQAEIHNRLDKAASKKKYRAGKKTLIEYDLVWRENPSHVFLTHDEKLIGTLSGSVEEITGRRPTLSTTGGTSDARFIKNYCPVVEFGLVGKTMHMVDERVALSDLETLTQVYERFHRGLVFGWLMEPYAYVLRNLHGVWQTMQGRRQGLDAMDVSGEGVWRSFQAVLVSLPMLWATWISALRDIEPNTALTPASIMLRLAFADAVAWLLPIALFALIARPAKLTHRAAHFIVTNNWGSVIFIAITALIVPFDLLGPDFASGLPPPPRRWRFWFRWSCISGCCM